MNQNDLRLEILKYLEKNSRVDLGELAVLLGVSEVDIANAMSNMEQEKIIADTIHWLIGIRPEWKK